MSEDCTSPFSGETPIDEKVLGGIEGGKRLLTRRLGLYFTQKRVVVARTGISSLWLLLMVVFMLFGLFLVLGEILMFGFASFTRELLEIFSGDLTILGIILETVTGKLSLLAIALILIIAPRVLIVRTMRRRFENFSRLPPEDILMADKKNFEIPYRNLARIEIIKAKARGVLSSSKIRILTNGEKHEFWLVRVVGFLGFEGTRERSKLAEYENFVRSVLPNKTFVLPKEEAKVSARRKVSEPHATQIMKEAAKILSDTPVTRIATQMTDEEMLDVLRRLCKAYMNYDQETVTIRNLEPIATEIGLALHRRGGIQEMRRIFHRLGGIPGSRTLEMHWNGIGDWRG